MSDWKIPLSDLDYGQEEEEAVLRVLRSKWLSMGPETAAFEEEFANLIEIRHAIAVSNGTAALHLSLIALGVGEGDEVIQPAINFVASANMTKAVGAKPVFADIVGLEEPAIDPKEVERLITKKTKAVIVMHYGGYLCRMTEIAEICQRHDIAIIEDACHAVGARFNGIVRSKESPRAGAIGEIGCFSFFSNKNMATGEGGMLTTDSDRLAQTLRLYRSHGMTSLTWDRHRGHASSYDVIVNGFNYRTDDLHAALGRAQLAKLLDNNKRRRKLLDRYKRRLATLSASGWTIPFATTEASRTTTLASGHLMTVVAPDSEVRKRIADTFRERGIQTSLHYPLAPSFVAFRRKNDTQPSKASEFAKRVLTLPLFPGLKGSDIDDIVAELLRSEIPRQALAGF